MKDYERGIRHFNELAQLYPQEKGIYEYRAEIYRRNEDYLHAAEDYTKILEWEPKSKLYLTWRGNCYKEIKDYKRAALDYLQLIEYYPNAYDGYSGLRSIYWSDYEGGVKCFTDVIKRYPKSAYAYSYRAWFHQKFKNYTDALKDYTKAITVATDKSVKGKFYGERARFYKEQNDYDNAIKDYTSAIECKPSEHDYYIERGKLYREMKDYDHAAQDYEQGIKAKRQYRGYNVIYNDEHKKLGDIYLEANKPTLAINFYEQSIKAYPDKLYFYKWLAELYKKLNQDERAYEVYGRYIERNPNDKEGYLARGTMEDYTQAIKLYPNNAELYWKRGNLYRDQEDYKHALEDYTRAIELSPKPYDIYFSSRASVYEKLGEYEKALADYDKVLELDPTDRLHDKMSRQQLLDKMKK